MGGKGTFGPGTARGTLLAWVSSPACAVVTSGRDTLSKLTR